MEQKYSHDPSDIREIKTYMYTAYLCIFTQGTEPDSTAEQPQALLCRSMYSGGGGGGGQHALQLRHTGCKAKYTAGE